METQTTQVTNIQSAEGRKQLDIVRTETARSREQIYKAVGDHHKLVQKLAGKTLRAVIESQGILAERNEATDMTRFLETPIKLDPSHNGSMQ